MGKFPYPMWKTVFDQLLQVVKGDAPQLKNTEHQEFSQECLQCVNSWYGVLSVCFSLYFPLFCCYVRD